ncbi:Uncharacterized protein TCAP_01044 [Tolypocladium capitatum]|uniref:PWI domain-containing protein n=1 Tax=Tolypocladium capitatum TaxID=45235 RepID=A0A2K3QNC5_9HYPO|nr:Uncharacterized protein TCAP_01044 [Tolypocladium capitatum]
MHPRSRRRAPADGLTALSSPCAGNPYGAAPPGYGGYGNPPPGMGAPPGLGTEPDCDSAYDGDVDTRRGADSYSPGPSPGMASAPGMAAPGVPLPPGAQQGNRPGLPPNFQPPVNMPNINFNAPVIRLGTGASGSGGRGGDSSSPAGGGRAGLGMERGGEHGRDRGAREAQQVLVPPTVDERLRTMAICLLPEGLGGDEGAQKICGAVGRFRKWEPSVSLWPGHDQKLGFVLFDDHESISVAMRLLREEGVDVPVERQPGTAEPRKDDSLVGIEKTKLHVSFDETTDEYQRSLDESQGDDPEFQRRLEAARLALKQVQRELFYPPIGSRHDADGDAAMTNNDEAQANVEVVNISIAQEDELADIPAEMREVVAKEIAAFRERSNQRDMERLKREEEIEERHRRQNGSSSTAGANNIPLGPRATTAPTGPRGQNGADQGVSLVNGGVQDRDLGVNDPGYDTDASDDELYRRILKKAEDEEHKKFLELERKWTNRERTRQLALDREREREQREAEQLQRRRDEQFAEEMAWDDELEARRKTHPYYRDHAAWARQRAIDRAREEALDDADRREEEEEKRREQAQLERARGQADSFLDQQDREADRHQPAAAAVPAPQPFKLSLGAAARGAQASRAVPQRRTIAEVEGLLDDEDNEPSVRRPLVPIQMDAASASAGMTEEEITQAVRALAQEIPSDKDGLWGWEVKWDYMDEGIVRERLRPFVEKKIVEYLGVQEEMLVETVEEHLRKHGSAGGLVEELEGDSLPRGRVLAGHDDMSGVSLLMRAQALDDEAEDLVKKLWRMVIFFTESEKRGLPA